MQAVFTAVASHTRPASVIPLADPSALVLPPTLFPHLPFFTHRPQAPLDALLTLPPSSLPPPSQSLRTLSWLPHKRSGLCYPFISRVTRNAFTDTISFLPHVSGVRPSVSLPVSPEASRCINHELFILSGKRWLYEQLAGPDSARTSASAPTSNVASKQIRSTIPLERRSPQVESERPERRLTPAQNNHECQFRSNRPKAKGPRD